MPRRFLSLLAVLTLPLFLQATPSGLNNIPTADVIGHREVAVQAFDTPGNGPHDFWMGFKFVRFTGGYGLQHHGNSLLLGLDRTWKIADHDLNLNVDLVQTNDQHGWLPAIGLKYEICKPIVFETWVNLPDHGDASVVLKLNYIFKF